MYGADLQVLNGNFVIPGHGSLEGNLRIEQGKIVAVGPDVIPLTHMPTLKAEGRIVLPGVIDPHVHPGLLPPVSERLSTLSMASAHGGVTTWIRYIRRPGSYFDFLPDAMAVSETRLLQDFAFHVVLYPSHDLSELPGLVEVFKPCSFKVYTNVRGALGRGVLMDLKSDESSVSRYDVDFDAGFLYRVCEKLAAVGGYVRLITHAEDSDIVAYTTQRVRAAGKYGLSAWDSARPPVAEAVAIHQAAALARHFRLPLYLPHIGSTVGIEAVRQAKSLKTDLVAETCPHHLVEPTADPFSPFAKVMPPIRSEADRRAAWSALGDETLETIGSDDVPFLLEEKGADFWTSGSGFPGSSRLLPLVLSEGVNKGRISIDQAAKLTSYNVARTFGLHPRKGTLLPGSDGDLVIVDLARRWHIATGGPGSESDFDVFSGHEVTGMPVATVVRGRLVAGDGATPELGWGRYLRADCRRR